MVWCLTWILFLNKNFILWLVAFCVIYSVDCHLLACFFRQTRNDDSKVSCLCRGCWTLSALFWGSQSYLIHGRPQWLTSLCYCQVSEVLANEQQHPQWAMTHKCGGHSMTYHAYHSLSQWFFSYSRWMEEKSRHIIDQNNAIKIICLDKLEILW